VSSRADLPCAVAPRSAAALPAAFSAKRVPDALARGIADLTVRDVTALLTGWAREMALLIRRAG